jgi:hypothetical protein
MNMEQARFNMIEQQIRPWDVLDHSVLQTMSDLPRDAFVSESQKSLAYADIQLPIGHDEYMTIEEFNHIYDRIFKLGKNTLFLTANSAYWQIRYADLNTTEDMDKFGRLMVCYKTMNDPITQYYIGDPTLKVTARFRDEYRYPETMLMGVTYQFYFSPKKNITFAY